MIDVMHIFYLSEAEFLNNRNRKCCYTHLLFDSVRVESIMPDLKYKPSIRKNGYGDMPRMC